MNVNSRTQRGDGRSADFQVCCIASFQTCDAREIPSAPVCRSPAGSEAGDTAGWETCATTSRHSASVFGLRPVWRKALASLAGLFLALPSAFACSACYGDPDSPMSRGLTWAIVALVGVISMVLTGVTAFFVHVNRRTTALEQAAKDSDPVNLRS